MCMFVYTHTHTHTHINDDYKWCERFLPINLCTRSHQYHLQFSLQVASPETFGYTLVVRLLGFVHTIWLFFTQETIGCARGIIWLRVDGPGLRGQQPSVTGLAMHWTLRTSSITYRWQVSNRYSLMDCSLLPLLRWTAPYFLHTVVRTLTLICLSRHWLRVHFDVEHTAW
jgi:hypothetical protein